VKEREKEREREKLNNVIFKVSINSSSVWLQLFIAFHSRIVTKDLCAFQAIKYSARNFLALKSTGQLADGHMYIYNMYTYVYICVYIYVHDVHGELTCFLYNTTLTEDAVLRARLNWHWRRYPPWYALFKAKSHLIRLRYFDTMDNDALQSYDIHWWSREHGRYSRRVGLSLGIKVKGAKEVSSPIKRSRDYYTTKNTKSIW